VGEEARKLFAEAKTMLDEFIAEEHVTLNAIIGLYPANAVGDDIEVYTDESRADVRGKLFGMRQQTEKDSKTDPYAPESCGLCWVLLRRVRQRFRLLPASTPVLVPRLVVHPQEITAR
jgi:cobalamin-dependent methionine synthase I